MMMLTSLLIATQQVNAQCPIPDINDVISFCTMENDLGITFPADTQHGKEVDYFPLTEYYGHAAGCLKHTNSGAWFTMQIEDPGDLVIMMSHSDNQDIDFACWGPFEGNTKKEMLTNICQNADANFSNSYQITYTDPNPCDEINCNLIQLPSEYAPLEEWDAYYDTTKKCDILHKAQKDDRAKNITDPCFRGFHDLYPYENMIDCSYTTAAKEACYIPNAKKSEWYILLITNYSEKPGDINFNKYSGSATTNCDIIVDANSTGPYCEGDDIELSVNNAPDGTAYAWRGPNGFSSNLQSPTIENSTIDMAGSYYVTLTNNGVKSKETEVIVDVYPSTVRDTTITILPRDSCEIGTVKLKITGTYSIKLTTELGCDSIINLTLNVEDNTIFRGTNNGPYCQGNSIQLSILGDIPTGSSIKWTGPDGFSSNLASPTIPNAEITNGGEYKLKIENEGKVFKTESTLVVVNEKYEIDTTVNVTIGDKITYAGEELTASMTTTIPKTFQSIKGCDSIVNLTLEVDTPIVVTSNAGPYCEGSDAKFSVMNVPTDATIEWIGPDGFSSTLTSPEITNVKTVNSGEYELKITRNGVSFMAKPCNLMVIHKYETDTTLHVMIGDKINFGEDKVIAKSSETLTKMFQSQNGCDSVVNLTLVVDTPKVVALNDGPYCEGATAKFSLSNIPTDATVLWHGPSNIASVIEDKTGNSPVINKVKSGDSGEYGLTVTRNGVSFDAVPCILTQIPQ